MSDRLFTGIMLVGACVMFLVGLLLGLGTGMGSKQDAEAKPTQEAPVATGPMMLGVNPAGDTSIIRVDIGGRVICSPRSVQP